MKVPLLTLIFYLARLLLVATAYRSGFCGVCHSEQGCLYPKHTDCRSEVVDFGCYKVYRKGKVVAMNCIPELMARKMGGKNEECTRLPNGDIFCMCSEFYCNVEEFDIDEFGIAEVITASSLHGVINSSSLNFVPALIVVSSLLILFVFRV